MKVLLVAKTFNKGGAASGATNLRKALCAQGHEVFTIDGTDLGNFTSLMRGMERLFDWLFFGKEFHFFKFYKSSISLILLDKIYKPDVIQICDVSGNMIDFSEIDFVKCPVVHRMSDFWPYEGPGHYTIFRKSGIVSNLIKSQFDFFVFNKVPCNLWRVAPSHWLKHNLKDAVRLSVIRNAVKVNPCISKEIPSEVIRFGFISNPVLIGRKGFFKLIEFLEFFSQLSFLFEINVWGEIPGAKRIFSENFKVNYFGTYEKNSVFDVYKNIDILLCPSQLDNSPNVVTEALSFGVPVVGQSNTGIDSYLNSSFGGVCDFSYKKESQRSNFFLIVKFIVENYKMCSEAAIKYVETELSYPVIGQKYTELYKSLLTEGVR